MNQKLLIILAVSANDGPLAERSLDLIYKLHGKKQAGHILIVANSDLHQELRQRLRITSELAFESVTETVAPTLIKEMASNKVRQMNNLFRHAAITVQTKFKWPWLWLEPDCVPLKPDWISQLADAYETQPRRYLGLVSKNASDKMIMARCGVYHPGASHELDKLCQGEAPFAAACAERIVESATHTPLVAYLPIESEDDIAKIPAKAVICHGDKQGIFAENWVAPATAGIGSLECERFEFMRPVANSSGAMAIHADTIVDVTMQPQEIAKEINEFLESSSDEIPQNVAILSAPLDPELIGNPNNIEDPIGVVAMPTPKRRGRPPKAKLDCVATNGCKSSTR